MAHRSKGFVVLATTATHLRAAATTLRTYVVHLLLFLTEVD
jgi:hypothetical protein